MAKISARGDRAAITLLKTNGARVVLTRRGRLLEQALKGSGYTLVDARWVAAGVAVTDRASVTHYLIEHRYPGATVA